MNSVFGQYLHIQLQTHPSISFLPFQFVEAQRKIQAERYLFYDTSKTHTNRYKEKLTQNGCNIL